MRKAKEKKPTNNNMTELNTDEMELANGGIDFDVKKAIGGAVLGGGVGAVGGACAALLLSGPVGWCIAGGVAIGAAAVAVGRGTRVLE
jgi:hypothetical protein